MIEDQRSDMIYLMPFLEHAASESQIIIEIGCGHGNGSTGAFARGIARNPAKNKLFLSVDIDTTKPELPPDLPYWYAVYGPSEEEDTAEMANYFMRDRNASLIFIDTDHSYEQLKKEHEVWVRFANEDTTWLYHDTWLWGPYNTMTDAAKQFAEAYGLQYDDVTRLSHGLGMVSKDGHPEWPRPEGVDDQCPKL